MSTDVFGGDASGEDVLGGARGAGAPDAPERTRLGELYGEIPAGTAAAPSGEFSPAVVRVVRGVPDADELAALIAGLSAAGAALAEDAEERIQVRHRWMDRSFALRGGTRGLPERSRDAWRWSLHP